MTPRGNLIATTTRTSDCYILPMLRRSGSKI